MLNWVPINDTAQEARLGPRGDSVRFTLSHHPTCYRRGPYRLLIEVESAFFHHAWGCFDDQDQPLRYFHSADNARDEADLIAAVLHADRIKVQNGPYHDAQKLSGVGGVTTPEGAI